MKILELLENVRNADAYRRRRLAEAAFDRLHGPRRFQWKTLRPEQWYKCIACNGTGSVEESGDAHRSAGIVPCLQCHNGVVKTMKIEIKRRVRVPCGSRVVD